MLQRQIMFKQLQELQRRQQLQELNNARNQPYVNQLSSLKQASGSQFPATFNGDPICDSSQMLMLGDMQMMQHGGSSFVQGFPSGSVLPQTYHHDSGHVVLSQPQFDMAAYGASALNVNKNLNQHSFFQEPSDMGRNSNSALGMSSMQPSNFGSLFMSQQGNFSSDQISAPDGSLLPNQAFQEKNLLGQVPPRSFDNANLPGSYSEQGITTQKNVPLLECEGRHNDATWHELPPGKVSNFGVSQPSTSLDPLEQKILYSTDDSIWESSFSGTGKMGTKDFENAVENTPYMDALPSLQSGSWSALMQSALAEMSGGDTGQEEWSGLSFQNPEPATVKSNYNNNVKSQNNWIDRNLQNESSPSSKPEQLQNSNMTCIVPGFPQSGHQYLKQKEEFHSETSHVSIQHSPRAQQEHPVRGCQSIQMPVSSPSMWPDQHNEHAKSDVHQPRVLSCTDDYRPPNYFSGHELKDNLWLHQSTSYHASGGIQKPFDQANQPNMHGYSAESIKMAPGEIVEPILTLLGASSGFHGQNITAQSKNIPNKDDISNNQTSGVQWNSKVTTHSELPITESSIASLAKPFAAPASRGFAFTQGPVDPRTPQSYSFFPSLSMGNSNAASLSSQVSAPPLQSHMASKYLKGISSPVTDTTMQQNSSFLKPNKLSNFFSPPDSASSSLETSSGAPNEQHNQKPWKHDNNVLEFGTYSEKSEYLGKQLQKGCPVSEGSTEIDNSALLLRSAHKPESFRNYSEADSVASHLTANIADQLPSSQLEKKVNETPNILARDMGAFGHSLSPNYPLLHQTHSPRNAETDKILLKNDGGDDAQAISNANNMFSSGQNSGVEDAASKLGASSSGYKGWNISEGSGKSSSMAYIQNLQPLDMFGQNNAQNHSIGLNEASNVTYQSHISPQMASTWFRFYGNLKNGQMLPVHNSKAAIGAAQPLSTMSLANLSNNAFQSIWPSTDATSIASKQESPSILPSDICCQNLVPSVLKKRKMVAYDMVPWYKEVNSGPSSHPNTNMAELEWTQASNRRQEAMQVKNDAEIVEDVLFPGVYPKRRLIFTTQLMQQVFRPPPADILCADIDLDCDSVAYTAARLALGDVCSMTHKLPPGTSDVSPDKLKNQNKTTAYDFSKVVEVLVSRVEKLEGDIPRLDKCSSIVDIKVATQELEKFAMLNRFAKFHIKAQLSTDDPASTKNSPQRYVVALPMPRKVPDGIGCISL